VGRGDCEFSASLFASAVGYFNDGADCGPPACNLEFSSSVDEAAFLFVMIAARR